MTVHQATQQLLFQLLHIYQEREARNITDLVMEKVTEWKRIDRIVNKGVPLSKTQYKVLQDYMSALGEHKPVQYVLNEAWFYGLKFFVDARVLIPRPETEELVRWLVETVRSRQPAGKGLRVLDIGTGSGCISVALKKEFPAADIHGCDISKEALEVAEINSASNEASIRFHICNFLDRDGRSSLPVVDIMVSNPPYVPLHNKEMMQRNVVNFEPDLALFVEDNDPLVFYQAVADFTLTHLEKKGEIFIEIHEDYAKAVIEIFQKKGFVFIELKQDFQGKDRMIRARLEN